MDEARRNEKLAVVIQFQNKWVIETDHLSQEAAVSEAEKLKTMLENGKFLEIYRDFGLFRPHDKRPKVVVVPKECLQNPDMYLKPGDIIRTKWSLYV